MVSTRAKSRTAVAPRRRLSRKFPVGGSEFLLRALLTLVISLVSTREGLAQWNADEVHVLPRPTARSQPSTPPTLRANVDMVLVNVTVLDRAGRAVRGLDAANFSILDGKHRQSVRYVSNADEPISLVVVLDASASMAPRILQERKAVTTLMSTSNPQDEIGLIAVGDRPQVIASFDDPMDKAQSALAGIQPDGETALWDAMYLGLKELKNAHHQRKAMVVISDGGDNHSRYSESELRSLLKEADVAVYAIGMFNRYARRREEKAGPLQLDEVTTMTGGRVFPVRDAAELFRAAIQISQELRNQYILGYYPTNRVRDGNWRKLKIQLSGSASEDKLRLYARRGYYAPAD